MTPEDSDSMSELAPADRFSWNLLGDLVFEDSYALWEAILSVDPVLADVPRLEATALSAQAVIALLEKEWIYLFRLEGLDPSEAFQLPELRLTAEEARQHVAQMLASGEPAVDIWIAPTELGTAAANEPPVMVRKLWGWVA